MTEERAGEYEVSSGSSSEGERSESVPVDRELTDTKGAKRRATLSPQSTRTEFAHIYQPPL